MSVYAMAVCDLCKNEQRSPVAHVSDSAYWWQIGGRRPIGWEYHMSHEGDNAQSILFCDECEEKIKEKAQEKVKLMIKEANL